MTAARFLLFALLPIFAGCQMFATQPVGKPKSLSRLQGELSTDGARLLFRPCGEQRQLEVTDDGDLRGDVAAFAQPGGLFADLRGQVSSPAPGTDGRFSVERLYRLDKHSKCGAAEFRQLILRASGNEPGWQVRVSRQGLVLDRAGEAPLALPYLEEQLPGGRVNLSSSANGQVLELWVAPQRCVDSMSGAVNHLSAELRLNGKVQRGCAYFGGARDD